MESALTEPLVRYPRFSKTAPRTLSIWQPRKPRPATMHARAMSVLRSAENMTMLESNALIPIKTPPAAAASCPLGEKPPFTPASQGLKVVIMRTRSSRQPISLAHVSEVATATAAANIHKPCSQSPRTNARSATIAGIPPFAATLIQPRWPSEDSFNPRCVFSSKRHFVATWLLNKKQSNKSNQVQ